VDHGVDAVGSAEDLLGLGPPGRALLSQSAGFVLVLPGLQVGLLREREGLDRSRRPAMSGLELDRKLPAARLDTAVNAGPMLTPWC